MSEEERKLYLRIQAEELEEERARKLQDCENKLREKLIRLEKMRSLLGVGVVVEEGFGGGGEDCISKAAAAIAEELQGIKSELPPSINIVQSDECSVAEIKRSLVDSVLGNGSVLERAPKTKTFLENVLLGKTSAETTSAEKKKAMLDFMVNYMWRALAPNRHITQWSLRIGVSCVVTRTPESLTDLLSALWISTSVNHSIKAMNELVTLGSTEMLGYLIGICEGKVILVHADNFCVITKLTSPNQGDGVVNI